MPRAPRIRYSNSWYHIINRGVARRHIFLNDHHRQTFVNLLAVMVDRFEVEVHAYCLMGNHYHLLIYTESNNISEAIRFLNQNYAQYFNQNRKKDGPLFKGRFKSILLKDSTYLVNTHKYIHRNPVRAGMIDKAEDYFWSSCKYYVSAKPPSWVKTEYFLARIPNYVEYIRELDHQKILEIYSKSRLPQIL